MGFRYLAFALIGVAIFAADGKIETIAGNGKPGYAADQLSNPYGLAIGPDGALYICDIDNHVVRRLDLQTKVVANPIHSRPCCGSTCCSSSTTSAILRWRMG